MSTSAPLANPARSIPRWEGVTVLLVTLACWCSVPLFLRHLSGYVDHWSNNGWRYGASALFWLPAVAWGFARGTLPGSIWRAALVPAAANAAAQVCFTAAHGYVSPGVLTFAMRLQLVAVAAGAYVLFPTERRTIRSPRYLCGIALLLAGIAGVLLAGDDLFHGATAQGVLLALGAGFGYGAYALAVRRFMSRFHPVQAFGVIALYTAAALVACMLAFGKDRGLCVLDLAPREMWYMGISAFVGIALGHVLYYTAIDRLGVAATTGVLQLQPFIVSAGSAMLLGEALQGGQWVAGLVAVAGAALVLSAQRANESATRTGGR
ncbi:MAG: DMT family transporter [Planctomycetota bacterium]